MGMHLESTAISFFMIKILIYKLMFCSLVVHIATIYLNLRGPLDGLMANKITNKENQELYQVLWWVRSSMYREIFW